ncbi:signal transduction histidine kinase regulating citrate/malate metabolism [Thermincola potens JR]|uniref:Signal transduction histidine kinase regulating citrate/malate metabolism n=1 Tax=Thermincola potens (strain JR) TaxID=635013 RepID=D5XCR8_THEPJ|nr:signal transduction histidine kinase regulating citrate/malate metabolism [Thermincola potens JR]
MSNKGLFVTSVLLGLVLVSIQFYFQTVIDGVTQLDSPQRLLSVVNGVIFAIILFSFFFTRKLLQVVKQERMLQVQEQYIDYLRDLIKVIRVQRHDFVNHMQAVYALLKTGEIEKAGKYIENLYEDVKITSESLRINIPEVSALLLVKMGIASAQNISFIIEIETGLEKIRLNPIELNTVLGNLIDNSFEAVRVLNSQDREVTLKIFDTGRQWVIQVHNQGYIADEIKEKIFVPGFSTKGEDGKRGFGLASVKSVVEKNHGEIIVCSRPEWGTRLTILFSKER